MAKKKTSNIGLISPGVYYADVLATGLPPEIADMTLYVGDIVPGSLARDDDEDTETILKSQETGETFADLLGEEGTKRFKFNTWNFDVDNLKLAMGGAVDTEGTWSAPIEAFRGNFYAMAYISRADEDSELHTVIKYPKVSLKGMREGTQAEDDGDKIMFTATLYKPKDASGIKKPDRYIEKVPAAPVNAVIDDTADSMDWDYLQNWDAYADYEYSDDGGSTWTTCTAKPQTGFTGAIPIGDAQIRVKADTASDTKHRAGLPLKNDVAFTL